MTAAEELGAMLRAKGLTLATAESCTGGRVGDIITSVPGSSDYYLGGVVSYSNDSKCELLGVDPEVMRAKGAVSEEVALQMAAGARSRFGADIGVSTTGIAGPGGGTTTKPVGLVYTAVSSATASSCRMNMFRGSREEVKAQAAQTALVIAKDMLAKKA